MSAQVEPCLGGLHGDVVGVDSPSDHEFVVQVDVEVAYWKKLPCVVKCREYLFNATLPFSKMGGNLGFKFSFFWIFEKWKVQMRWPVFTNEGLYLIYEARIKVEEWKEKAPVNYCPLAFWD